MRKAVAGFWWSPASEGVSALAVTAAFFALGGAFGFFISARAVEGSGEVISSYLEHFLSGVRLDGLLYPDLLQFLWLSLRWPLVAFALGFSALGIVGLPVLSGLRGFLLSFSVGTFARALGRRGLEIAILLLGVSALISIPIFLLVVAQSFSASRGLASRGSGQGKRDLPFNRAYAIRCGFSLLFLCAGLILEWFFVPTLLTVWLDVLL